MQLSQLYVSARDAPGESATRLAFAALPNLGSERGSLSQLKPHFCKKGYGALRKQATRPWELRHSSRANP
eukprot:6261258-Prymnesium_polylepis.1